MMLTIKLLMLVLWLAGYGNDPINEEFVIKRSVGTGGGESVEIGNADKIIPFFNLYCKKKYDFVVQPLVKQHDKLAEFNPSSLNTVRIMTLAYDGNVHHVSSMVKMGASQAEELIMLAQEVYALALKMMVH